MLREGKLPADEWIVRPRIEDIRDIFDRKHVTVPQHGMSGNAAKTGTIGTQGLWFECFD